MRYGWLFTCLLLASCSATRPPAYQADRAPENRDSYNGLKGMSQYVKDQSYLQQKALSEKCEEARLDLLEAQKNGNQTLIDQSKQRQAENCQEKSS